MRLSRSVRLSVGMALSDCRGYSPRGYFLSKVFIACGLGPDHAVRRCGKSLESRGSFCKVFILFGLIGLGLNPKGPGF